MAKLSGDQAVGLMLWEIGDAIGASRLREFERKVRKRMLLDHGGRGTGNDWIDAMARVIVEDGDARADRGFRKGIRLVRSAALSQSVRH